MENYDVRTARELRANLEMEGVTGEAQELVVRMTAPARHELRTQDALSAAFMVVYAVKGSDFGEDAETKEKDKALAWAVLSADSIGVGGTRDSEGRGTVRIPALSELGKGRKQATDGRAWTAAIRAARLSPDLFTMFCRWEPSSTLNVLGVAYSEPELCGAGVRRWVEVPAGIVPLRWQKAILDRMVQRVISPTKGWESEERFASDASLSVLAGCYNGICARMDEQRKQEAAESVAQLETQIAICDPVYDAEVIADYRERIKAIQEKVASAREW